MNIGSLCCDTAEEAKTLIPSLQDKITDDELQELLDEITKLMGYGNWIIELYSRIYNIQRDGELLRVIEIAWLRIPKEISHWNEQ